MRSRHTTIRAAVLAAGLVALAGCQTSAELTENEAQYWSRADTDDADFSVDRKTCVDEVELGLYEESWLNLTLPGGGGGASRRQDQMWWAEREYQSCMEGKGWVLAPGVRVGAPRDIYYL